MRVGMGQLLVEGGEPERNMERGGRMVGEAKAAGCDLIILPETLDLGWTHPSALTEGEPIPGPRSQMLCDFARDQQIYICAGLTEQDGGQIYNTAILIDDCGEILLKYRKINILDVAFPFYGIGDLLRVVDTKFGRVGINICSDNYSDCPELGHSLARMGAQLILSPSSWTVDYSTQDSTNPYQDKWLRPYHRLAAAHGIVVVSTTAVGYIVGGPYEGKKMVGCSLCVGADGVIAAGSYNEVAGELAIAEFDVPDRAFKGTQIGQALTKQGFYG